ncbi:hypothetical protein A9Q76_07390, partial [Arcobacter sp. 31_11_sub10_T18]
ESHYYKALTEEDKAKFDGKGLYLSKVPVEINKETATHQNSVNGMMNNEAEAIKNGLEQTGQFGIGQPVELTVGYNPSYGFLPDLLESAVDTSELGTTGIAKQTGQFVLDLDKARADKGANIALHSQGNPIVYNGIQYIMDQGEYKATGYFKTDTKNLEEDNKMTFVSFGSPKNGAEMKKLIKEKLDATYSGAYTKKDDFVGEALGGNSGNNGTATLQQKVDILNAFKLFGSNSPHSSYRCEDYGPKVQCGYRK